MAVRPTRRTRLVLAPWALACLPLLLLACGPGRTGLNASLGEPRAGGPIIYRAPGEGRFDFFVYLPNTSRSLEDRARRLAEVRRMMRGRCEVAELSDLYAHDVGMWPDGRVRTYYTIGVRCAERLPPLEGPGTVERP